MTTIVNIFLLFLIIICIISHIYVDTKINKLNICNCNKNISTYIDRMILEYDELEKKINKLNDFLSNPKCSKIASPYQIQLMKEQLSFMINYRDVLNSRINYEINTNKAKEDNNK